MEKDDLFVIFGIQSQMTLERSKGLAELAASESNANAKTLSACALILAIAHLSQSVESLLLQALALVEVDAGHTPNLFTVRNQLGRGLSAWLYQLPTVISDRRVRFAATNKRPSRLLKAIELRNELIHQEGMLLIGTLESSSVSLEGETLKISISSPEDPWEKVSSDMGEITIADVEDYLHEIHWLRDDKLSLGESEFFR